MLSIAYVVVDNDNKAVGVCLYDNKVNKYKLFQVSDLYGKQFSNGTIDENGDIYVKEEIQGVSQTVISEKYPPANSMTYTEWGIMRFSTMIHLHNELYKPEINQSLKRILHFNKVIPRETSVEIVFMPTKSDMQATVKVYKKYEEYTDVLYTGVIKDNKLEKVGTCKIDIADIFYSESFGSELIEVTNKYMLNLYI